MFHWICPECGREIPPTVKECPACDPRAVPVAAAPAPVEHASAAAPEPVEAVSAPSALLVKHDLTPAAAETIEQPSTNPTGPPPLPAPVSEKLDEAPKPEDLSVA